MNPGDPAVRLSTQPGSPRRRSLGRLVEIGSAALVLSCGLSCCLGQVYPGAVDLQGPVFSPSGPRLEFRGAPWPVLIQASTNLAEWTSLGLLAPQNGAGSFADTQWKHYPSRFYRLRQGGYSSPVDLSVDTLEELTSITGVESGALVEMRGYAAPGDGGGGVFIWDPASTEAADGGVVVAGTTNPDLGRWIRAFAGAVNALWFGALSAIAPSTIVPSKSRSRSSGSSMAPTTISSRRMWPVPRSRGCVSSSIRGLAPTT